MVEPFMDVASLAPGNLESLKKVWPTENRLAAYYTLNSLQSHWNQQVGSFKLSVVTTIH